MSFIIQLTQNSALYVGSFSNANSMKFMEENNIKMIVNCTQEHPNFFEDQFKYIKVPLLDDPEASMDQYFKPTFQWVVDNIPQGGNILVHCAFGVSRSATMAIALIMQFTHLKRIDAQTIVEMRRPIISPNPGFIQKLMELQEQIEAEDEKQDQTQIQQQEESKSSSSDLIAQIRQNIINQFKTEFRCSFRCRKCNLELFQGQELVHGLQNACTSIFFENSKVLKDFPGNDGVIECPKCKSKLGAYKLSGIQCWCDTWIAPAYQIQKFKVDRKIWNIKTSLWE